MSTVDVESLEKAMDLLHPHHAIWLGGPGDWVFRGHADASWLLLPSAFRDDALLYNPNTSRLEPGRGRKVLAQIEREWRTLRLFLAQADQAGLPFATPDDAMFDHGVLQDTYGPLFTQIKDGNIQKWPPRELLANIGLAQHYGIHTRLLDFSTQLPVAAYFAAASAAEGHLATKDPRSDLVAFTIWAVRLSGLDFLANAGTPGTPARVVRVPRANNPNLHAQSGVFLHYWPYGPAATGEDDFAPEPLDTVLSQAFAIASETNATEASACSPLMVRLNIPRRWAPDILRKLAEQGASPASFFPGYDGAALAVKQRQFWR